MEWLSILHFLHAPGSLQPFNTSPKLLFGLLRRRLLISLKKTPWSSLWLHLVSPAGWSHLISWLLTAFNTVNLQISILMALSCMIDLYIQLAGLAAGLTSPLKCPINTSNTTCFHPIYHWITDFSLPPAFPYRPWSVPLEVFPASVSGNTRYSVIEAKGTWSQSLIPLSLLLHL